MAYKPPKQSIVDNDLKGVPSNEAVFEGLKLKLPKPSVDGTTGQLLARGATADDTSWVNPPSALPAGALEHQVLVYDGAAATWAYAGLGDGGLGTDNVILGSSKPSSLTGIENVIIGPTGVGSAITSGRANLIIGNRYAGFYNYTASGLITGDQNTIVGIGSELGATTQYSTSLGVYTRISNATQRATALGFYATATGSRGTAVGSDSSSAIDGIALGYNAQTGSGADNIVIGISAGRSAATGTNNIFMGRAAATSITTASNNCIIGTLSSVALTTSSGNVFIGKDSAKAISTGGGTGGNANVAIGLNSLSVNTSALGVTVIGNDAATGSTADYSTVIGSIAGNNGAVGTLSVLVGHRAAGTGANIVSIGANATCGTGANSVAIGQGSISVANSVAIGSGAQATGSNQFVCGSNGTSIQTVAFGKGLNVSTPNTGLTITNSRTGAGYTNADGSTGHLTLTPSNSTGDKSGGDLIVQTAPAGTAGTTLNAYVERLRVTAAGNVGIGTATPSEKLEVNGNIKGGTISFNADSNRTGTVSNLGFKSNTITHDFGSISHGNSAEVTITVSGAAVGDAVFVGPPAAPEIELGWSAYVSAADTVTLRVYNTHNSNSVDPASATWRVTVLKS